jgi:hypothetical protein
MSEWSHLPNASHIDRILLDLRTNPDNWIRAWAEDRDAAWIAAWNAARDAAWIAAWIAARDAARVAAWNAARDAALYAIMALIAWDESASYLELDRDQLLVLSVLGDHKATLILPAVVAFEQNKEFV